MDNTNKRLILGAVLFEGFELLDIYGPLEMFGILVMLKSNVEIIMIGEKIGPVKSAAGPCGYIDKSFLEIEDVDILLIPGGTGTRTEINNRKLINSLKELSNKASYVATICTGSALLAKTELLNGIKATSNKMAFHWVTEQGPKVKWIHKARWVEDGKFFTSSGVSAGMDMTLGLIEKIYGKDKSLKVANLAEYEWHQDKSCDPFYKTN